MTPLLLSSALPYLPDGPGPTWSALACTCRGLRRVVLAMRVGGSANLGASLAPLPSLSGWPASILTVGDGNLTFSLGLQRALALEASTALAPSGSDVLPRLYRMVATTYDDEASLFEKYPEARPAKLKLQQLGVTVMHRVNAISLAGLGSFSAIVFNHPHLGIEDAKMHRILLAHFFHSCRPHLRPGARVYVSLVEGQPERWKLLQEANRAGYFLVSRTPMTPDQFPGYEIRRTHSGRSFVGTAAKSQSNFSQSSSMFCFSQRSAKVALVGGSGGESSKMSLSLSCSRNKAATSAAYLRNNRRQPKRKRTNPPQNVAEFRCIECERTFSTAQGLRTHTHQVHVLKLYDAHNRKGGVQELQCKCTKCDRVFASEDALSNHTRAKHGLDQSIVAHWKMREKEDTGAMSLGLNRTRMCSTASSGSVNELSAGKDKRVQCNICDCSFPDRAVYQRHFVLLEPIVKKPRHPCPGCNKIFGDVRALRQHINFCRAMEEDGASLNLCETDGVGAVYTKGTSK